MENKKSINNMEYVLVGDYYIPDLKLPNEERPIGKYGRMHREYLKEHNPMMFNALDLSCQSERAGTKSPEMYYRADEGRRGRDRGSESQ